MREQIGWWIYNHPGTVGGFSFAMFLLTFVALTASTIFLGLILRKLSAIHRSLTPQARCSELRSSEPVPATSPTVTPIAKSSDETRFLPKSNWPARTART
jgi:hypothetical protein